MSRILILASVIFVLGSTQSYAQQVVKRVKCSDAAGQTGSAIPLIYENNSNAVTRVTVQIVRDGCRPKLTEGTLSLTVSTTFSSAFFYFVRNGKSTSMLDFEVPDDWTVQLYFYPGFGVTAKGTLDYVIDAK